MYTHTYFTFYSWSIYKCPDGLYNYWPYKSIYRTCTWFLQYFLNVLYVVLPRYQLMANLVPFLHYRKSSLVLQVRQRRPFANLVTVPCLSLFLLYDSSFDVGVKSEISCTYACMISSPASLHACFLSYRRLGMRSILVLSITLGGGGGGGVESKH